ncbi:MAG: hypothetical protein ACREMS_06425 [Gemmatimonadaceae bacterium]
MRIGIQRRERDVAWRRRLTVTTMASDLTLDECDPVTAPPGR